MVSETSAMQRKNILKALFLRELGKTEDTDCGPDA
jgi:hypothetical protein